MDDAKFHLFGELGPEPLRPSSAKSAIEKEYEEYTERAHQIYEEKCKAWPELVKFEDPKEKMLKKKFTKEISSIQGLDSAIPERITDQNGKEIKFHKPNGDALNAKVPFTVKLKITETA